MFKRIKSLHPWREFFRFGVIAWILYLVVRSFFDRAFQPDYEAYCPFGGLQAAASLFEQGSLACTMSSVQIVMGAVLAIGVIIFSKLFCGVVCPLGTITEKLSSLGRKWKLQVKQVPEIADKFLRSLKYILLFVTVYYTVGSSELFCKTYDPYYAATTGFGSDVNPLWAGIALLVFIVTPIFIRTAWCRYLCPLGAVSNIFRYFLMFSVVTIAYILTNAAGLQLSYVWPLAAVTILAWLFEIQRKASFPLPLHRITRNNNTCNNCEQCTDSCPQGIPVGKLTEVRHIDCNLCGACVASCHKQKSLTINHRYREWYPIAIASLLIVLGLFLGASVRIPTIEQQWGETADMENASTMTLSGLDNVKCYGSSMAFASGMKKVNGVLGVATYVDNHSVKIWYDASKVTPTDIRKNIFTPVRRQIKPVLPEVKELGVITAGIDQLYDIYDAEYLQHLLLQNLPAVYGFETTFDCPVRVNIYYDKRTNIGPNTLKKIIEKREIRIENGLNIRKVKLNYQLSGTAIQDTSIARNDFIKTMFIPFRQTFSRFEQTPINLIDTLRLKYNHPGESSYQRMLPYLTSHLSVHPPVLGIRTTIVQNNPELQIFFNKKKASANQINEWANADMLEIHYANGKTGSKNNPFRSEN
ncbi:hypothetical protein PbJCM13498_18570 [Prolixibacter bellariivorans]|uniref:4Fe-4S ferredoxin-type domain-containing protein n=1 Tax=Prolixibacter bellariivorans TaxID=314319 RepID=A0A5M4AYY9_9BACT|nr:4Fe-4S binding protein [Prolixibacter bellariivorans]GET32994.1 hypothetical protein PbJCM13498_18570 [Prolixibacter bellariivorans]